MIKKWFIKKIAIPYILKQLKYRRNDIMKYINKKVDFPILNEEEEIKLLNNTTDVIEDVINRLVNKDLK